MRSILLVFFLAMVCSAQNQIESTLSANYRFSHIGVEQGVSPGAVNSFFKEKNGFLWIATSSGLNRYDGYTVRSFNPHPSNSQALQTRNCKAVFQDPLGNIWVVTVLGINIFDPLTETFTADQKAILNKLKLPNVPVKNMVSDKTGDFWIVHGDNSLSKFSSETKKVKRNEAFNPENLVITSIFPSEDGNLWVIYETGLIQQLDADNFKILKEIDVVESEFQNPQDFQIVSDHNGNLWIHLFEDFGLFHYDNTTKVLKQFNTETPEVKLSSNLVSAISRDADGKIWVGTDHGGIMVIDPDDFSHQQIEANGEIANSLASNSITAIHTDTDGITWIGTFKSGLNYYHPNILRFNIEQNLLSDPESLPFSDVNVFTEDSSGNLYIGTNGGGLIVKNRHTGKYTQYLNDPEDSGSIPSNIIVSLLCDSQDNIWIGTYMGGLVRMNSSKFQIFQNDPEDSTSLKGNNIWELFEDSTGKIWIGTLTQGLQYLEPTEDLVFRTPTREIAYTNKNTYISSIAEDKDANIWIGGDNGVEVFNAATGYQHYYNRRPQAPSSLSNSNILAIHNDSDNNTWIATESGLDLYNPSGNDFYHYSQKDGLPGEKILGIVEDDQKSLWMTTPYGVVQFDKHTSTSQKGKPMGDFIIYKQIDGLQGNSFNENSIYKSTTGTIYVGGLNGYNTFKPEAFDYNRSKPNVIFTGFSLFNKPIAHHTKVNGRTILNAPIQKTSAITLKYDENIFSIEFAALDFFQPSKNKYKYKLEGFEESWQVVEGDQRRVTYTNLDPGNYTFKVLASNNDQLWNDIPEQLKITIKPPFYKTYYAYVTYLLLILGLLYFARRRIINKQQRKFVIEQEKRESAHLHKMDLMKIKFFTNVSHEFKSPLSLILSPAEKLKKRDIGREANEHVDVIYRNAQKLLNLINQILDLGNIKNDKLLDTSKGNIIHFIGEIVENFKDLAKSEGVYLQFVTAEDQFHTSFDRDKLDKIVYNLVANAIKFTPAGGKVTVETRIETTTLPQNSEKFLQLKVVDTGIGINNEDLDHIFDRFYKVDQPNRNTAGSGIGLTIVREYVKLYNGEITVTSDPGKGSTFILRIPLKEIDPTLLQSAEANIKIELPRILLVSHSKDTLNLLTKKFQNSHNVFIAPDGETGWKKALSATPDLIISDQNLSSLPGTAFCSKIRKDSRTKHIPFILLTTINNEEAMEEAFKAGVSDYIVRPFNFQTLATRVENLINQRKSFQEIYSKKLEIPEFENAVPIEGEDEKLMKKVLKLIQENIGNSNFSVKKLSSELGVSRSFLYLKCTSLLEKSPQDLIIESKLEFGKELLKKSDYTISEIAFKTGFNNPKNFTRNFKKKYDQLPSDFRQKETSSPT